jgi:toxin CcdB
MAQFDVHANLTNPGYLLDCQSNLLSDLNTRFVVPLLPHDFAPKAGHHLNPSLTIGAEKVVMMTQFAAAVPSRSLGKVVGSLADDYTLVMNAIDMLITGY